MSDYTPTKIKHVTNECRYCGDKMYPCFNNENGGRFYFRCLSCGSQTPTCAFSPAFINADCLLKYIDYSLLGHDLDFEFEEDEEEDEEEEEEEEEDIQDDKRKQIDAIKAMHSAILNSYNVFKQKVVNEFDNEDNQDQ